MMGENPGSWAEEVEAEAAAVAALLAEDPEIDQLLSEIANNPEIDALLVELNNNPEIDQLVINLSAQWAEIDAILAGCAEGCILHMDLDGLEFPCLLNL
jgi:NADP-dependent 3-hydroxy acid dehydrogenase YdfG